MSASREAGLETRGKKHHSTPGKNIADLFAVQGSALRKVLREIETKRRVGLVA